MKRFLGLLLACLMLCAPALGETAPVSPAPADASAASGQPGGSEASLLTAVGSGAVTLTPDIAVLTFRLSSAAVTVAEAQAASAADAEKLYAALESAGVSREDMHADHYSTATAYSYQYGKLGEGESPSGFSAQCDVLVRLRNMDALGTVIDVAMQSGADSGYEMNFESSQAQAAYDRALSLATADAMRKAALLATTSGLTLGAIASIRECDGGPAPVSARESMAGTGEASGVHYEMQITASVEICCLAK